MKNLKELLDVKMDVLSLAVNNKTCSRFKLVTNMLEQSENLPEEVEPWVDGLEQEICAQVDKKYYPKFYKELDAINNKISAYKESCLVKY